MKTAAAPFPCMRLKSITVNSQSYNLDYDANGNLTTGYDFATPATPATRQVAYDSANMPSAINRGSSRTEFLYDGDGKRVKKSQGSSATFYIDDTFEITNGRPVYYIFAGNQRIAKYESSTYTYFHKDHLGSTSVMTNGQGEEISTSQYLPFGAEIAGSGSSHTTYKFTDQELDQETGLYNYDARLYDPVVGRFISADSVVPDWYDPQTLDRYAYARNNPVRAAEKINPPEWKRPVNAGPMERKL